MGKPKYGRGIILTHEALVEVLRQRFPTMVDWDTLSNLVPHITDDPEFGHVGLYFVGRGADPDESPSGYPIRRIGEGAPIPAVMVNISRLVREDRLQRCGYFHPSGVLQQSGVQCSMRAGHTDSLDANEHDASGQ